MFQFVGDRLQNLVSGLGTAKDKSTRSTYALEFLTPEQLVYAYRGDWIARKVVDVPAFDMVRSGRNWQAEGDHIEKIEAEESRLQIRGKLLKALKWARLFGGAGLVLGVRQGDPSEELRIENLGKGALEFVHVVGASELTVGELIRDPMSPFFGEPSYYEMRSGVGTPVRIHPSRVIRFIGAESPDYLAGGSMGCGQGWGDSVLLAVSDALKNAGLAASGIAALLTEAKIDVFKIKGLTANVLQADYRTKMLARFALANEGKSIQNALIMDAEEEWEQKQISFAQLPELMQAYLQIAAGAADIPATRLLGQAPSGMNSTGESDVRNYYDRLSGEQEMHLRPALEKLDEVLIRSALGSRPPEAYFTFAPLWQLSEKERAEIFKAKAEAARTIAGTGGASPALMPIEALSDSLVNALVEDGSLPGLEAAIEEYGKLSDQEEDPADAEAAMTPQASNLATGGRQDASDPFVGDAKRRKPGHVGRSGRLSHFDPMQPRGGDGRWITASARIDRARSLSGQNVIHHEPFATIQRHGELKNLTGRDLRGFRHSVSNQAIAHATNEHPDLTTEDFRRIPAIVQGGKVSLGDPAKNGSPRLKYQATIDGVRYGYIAEVRNRKGRLDMVTLYRR